MTPAQLTARTRRDHPGFIRPDVNDTRAGATTRSYAMTALFTGVALMNAAMAVASAASTIVAAERLGTGWGGVPSTAGIVGTGIGALAQTAVMSRRGRRAGLTLGYVSAALGAGLTVAAMAFNDIVGLSVGMLLIGLGNAGAQLSRYAAAELYPAPRRGVAIGTVVWAGTVGAVGGPLLLLSSSQVATRLGWAGLTGPFLLATLAGALAVVATMSMPGRGWRPIRSTRVPLRELLRTHAARSAFAVMATGQVVMVAVMTAAPLDMHIHGHGLGLIGTALSMHTLGMFALSPLTGRLLDRVGARPVMLGGLLALAVACLAVLGSGDHALTRTAALFLLGYGWNLCFVGGSGQLARGRPTSEQPHLEGAVDAAVWGLAAIAGLASTAVLAAGGYAILAGAAGALVALPASVLLAERRVAALP
jgi:MFS family permease